MSTRHVDTDRAAEARRKHKDYLHPSVANFYEEPLVLDSGSGLRVRDVDGREYLDFFGGILTVSLGHGDPRVGAAIHAQVDRLVHVSSLYPLVPVVDLGTYVGVGADAPERAQSGVLQTLHDRTGQGHVFVERADLRARAAAMLERDEGPLDDAIDALEGSRHVHV